MTLRERTALLLQAVASNPRAPQHLIASSLGITGVGSIVFGALVIAHLCKYRERRLWFAEAECIVRCSRVVFSDEETP